MRNFKHTGGMKEVLKLLRTCCLWAEGCSGFSGLNEESGKLVETNVWGCFLGVLVALFCLV